MKDITYGKSLAYIIIAANKLGGNFRHTKECDKIIKNEDILPSSILSIERAAISAKHWVIKKGLTGEAHKIVDTLI